VHLSSNQGINIPRETCSNQVILQHPKGTAYRCFLSNLTGFTDFRRAGPDSQYKLLLPEEDSLSPRIGIKPRWSGLRVEGTANSPPSTTRNHSRAAPKDCQRL